jgi:Rrf2 family iron-sulfur cluster assembly transcriptional regulator
MRLTTKGRFAVTAMIDLALRQNNGPVTLAAISQRQQISLSYLEQLFGKLRRHELVESTRGPGGGYTLARKAGDITVADIIVSVDEPIDATQCGGKENCLGEAGRCMTHELWASLNQRMVEFLDSVTLQKLVDEQLAKGVQIEDKPMYARHFDHTSGQAHPRERTQLGLCTGQRVRQILSCLATVSVLGPAAP